MFSECKALQSWQENRRKILKALALTGLFSYGGTFGSVKYVFADEGGITPEEMRQKAMQLFLKDKPYQ